MERKSPDLTLAILVGVLMVLSIVMISSVSVYSSYDITTRLVSEGKLQEPHNSFYLNKSMLHIVIGLLAIFIFSKIPYYFFEKYAKVIFILSIFGLLIVFNDKIGLKLHGSNGWIEIAGFSLQPVEFVKLGLIFILAYFMKKHKSKMASFDRGFVPFYGYVGVIILLLIFQPDFGAILIIAPITLAMYFIGGGNIKYLMVSFLVILVGVVGIYFVGKAPVGKTLKVGYVSARIDNFFRSNHEITESRNIDKDKGDFQLKQAFIALGSGGLFGLGFGKSIQKFGYLPEVQGDFIFSVYIEEFGFVGGVVLIFIYLWILYRGFLIARSVKDLYGKYVAFGITTWIGVQTFINIGVNLNIIPLTGVTLPFVSYGGSSFISLSVAIGVLLSISRHSEYKPTSISNAIQARKRVVF